MAFWGSGDTASVFHVKDKSVKMYNLSRNTRFDEFRNECKVLAKVNAVRSTLPDGPLKRALPKLVYPMPEEEKAGEQVSADPLAIVTSPVGISLIQRHVGDVWLSAFIPVVQALQSVHSQGIVHRDLGPYNWICIADGELSLIDWAFAVGIDDNYNKSGAYSGSIWYGADSLMELFDSGWKLKDHNTVMNFNAKTDLETVVKTIVYMTVPGVRTYIEEKREMTGNHTEPKKTLETWKEIWKHNDAQFILPLRDLARAGDHDGMVRELARLHTRKQHFLKGEYALREFTIGKMCSNPPAT